MLAPQQKDSSGTIFTRGEKSQLKKKQYFFYNTTRLFLHIPSTIYTSENRGNTLPIPKFTCIIRSQIDEMSESYNIRHFAASGSGPT